jgi:hypothetical protein
MSKDAKPSETTGAAKLAANRRNARKSTGPKDTSATRRNALKSGLLAVGITDFDNANEFRKLRAELVAHYQPVGPEETFQVEQRIPLCMVRVGRAVRLEAETITAELYPIVEQPSGANDPVAADRIASAPTTVKGSIMGLPGFELIQVGQDVWDIGHAYRLSYITK